METIHTLKKQFDNTLILNPTENIPFLMEDSFDFLDGLYVSNETRNQNSKVIFGGRNNYTDALNRLNEKWSHLLRAKEVNLRVLSGLHAHIITFMSIGNISDNILLLAEEGGGHYSGQAILERLGFRTVFTVQDNRKHCINIEATMNLIKRENPKFAFIDRSEGLYYEDFSWLKEMSIPYMIFDASQYLTQIITGEYKNPFDMGFDLILSTLHKNYPGPQKAILATNEDDSYWKKLSVGCNTYISNSHPKELFKAGHFPKEENALLKYSKAAISYSQTLEYMLSNYELPVIQKDSSRIPTQHIWLHIPDKVKCYKVFKDFETAGFLVNYRLLPYNLGYGLRLGTGGAIQSGLRENHIVKLASLMAEIFRKGLSIECIHECSEFITCVKKEGAML